MRPPAILWLTIIGRKSMRCLFIEGAVMRNLLKKLAYQEILSYHIYQERGALEERCVSGAKIVERGSQLPILERKG